MNYKHYPVRPGALTPEFVKEEYEKLTGRISDAESSASADAWISLYEDWNALNAFIYSEGSRIHHDLSKNMADPENEAREQFHRENVQPVAEEYSSQLVNALIKSKHRQAVGERFGTHLLEVLQTMIEPLDPVNSELRVKIGELVTKYDKLVSGGEVMVGGEMITLSKARSYHTSENPVIRRESYEAYRKWFLEHRAEIAGIYDAMVKLRDQMGRNLGHENFIRLGYKAMGRTDYGVEEAKQFRDNVRKYVVPLQTKLFEARAKRLGTPTLKPWDVGYDPATTLPSGIAPVGEQVEKAQRIFDKLSPVLAAHFRRMREENLIDLENRKGKRAGAYCTSFPDEGRVAILCNSTGDSEDIRTLTHEMGHAFQGWESQPIEAVDLQWPTSDACEVHSMGMEFLAMRYIDEFFDAENAAKYRKHRWSDAVEVMCYIAIVDEFQHWVYENPNATPTERDVAWSRIWDIYKPGIDFTGCEEYKYARWYAQGHIFGMPFYYIDYAIAETGAMQLGRADASHHEKVIEDYIELCRIGGTKSVLNIFKAVDMRSPFDETLMKDLMEHAEKVLFAPQPESVEA
jgi:M3 family oligoendopeptidase